MPHVARYRLMRHHVNLDPSKLELQGWALPDLNSTLQFWMAWNEQRNQQHIKDGDKQQSGVWHPREASLGRLRKGIESHTSCDKGTHSAAFSPSGFNSTHTQTEADLLGKAENPGKHSKCQITRGKQQALRPPGHSTALARGQRWGENLVLYSQPQQVAQERHMGTKPWLEEQTQFFCCSEEIFAIHTLTPPFPSPRAEAPSPP